MPSPTYQKANPSLINQIQEFLSRELEARSNARRNPQGLSPQVLSAFRSAFHNGGLSAVDDLITSINEELIFLNSLQALREGCGLEHGKNGDPAFLQILFVDLSTDIAIFGVSISL